MILIADDADMTAIGVLAKCNDRAIAHIDIRSALPGRQNALDGAFHNNRLKGEVLHDGFPFF